MTTSYLMLTEEMFKNGIDSPQAEGIVGYFLGRDVLYRHDDLSRVVKEEMATTFHPSVGHSHRITYDTLYGLLKKE